MKKLFGIKITSLFAGLLLAQGAFALTSASCTGTTITTCSTYPTPYSSVGNIVITEGNNSDFTSGNGRTLVLSAPANFEFNTTGVTVANTNGSRLSNLSVVVTTTTITVTYDQAGGGGGPADEMTIYGVQVRATAASGVVNITRSGGTGVMSGFVAGSNVAGNISTNDLGPTGTKTWVSGATWATATWSPAGAPGTCHDVILPAGCVLTNGAATTVNSVTIQSGAQLTANSAITVLSGFTIDNGGTYVHNYATDPTTNIFAGTESFGATSTFHITNWNSPANPVGQYANSWGNIIFDVAAYTAWDQDGTFAPAKIQGDVTIIDCQLNFDDGTGATTALTVGGDISTSGTGGCIFAQGADRNLTLVTGSFTHNGTGLAAGMYLVAGTFDWTVNGSISVADDFTGIEGGGSGDAVVCNVTTTGDFNISAGLFDWNRGVNGPVTLNIGGDINITGAPGWVRFNDGFAGSTTVSCTNFNIAGGTDNDFTKASGVNSYTITGALTHSGATTETHIVDIDNGNLSLSAGSVTMNNGSFYGCYLGDADVSYTVTGGFNMVDGSLMLVYNGDGNATLNVGGTLDMDAGDLRGIYENTGSTTAGLVDMDFGAIDYDGGLFIGSYANNGTTGANTFTVVGDANLNYTGSGTGESVRFGVGLNNGTLSTLDLDIGGDLIISGNLGGITITHLGSGNEDIDIVGNVTISGGENTINGYVGSALTCDHDVTLDIGGNLTISNGTTSFSKEAGTLTAGAGNMIDGNVTISGGTSNFKQDDGSATITIGGNYSQTGGNIYLHQENANATADVISMVVTGSFSHTGGFFSFDDNTSSTATHTVTLNGSAITVGGTGTMARAGAGSATVFGEVYVNPTSGTTTYNRTGDGHNIRQARIIVNPGKIMDASGSTEDIQIAANDAADDVIPPTTIMLDVQGVVNAGTKSIFGRAPSAIHRPTSVYVKSGGEIQTANTLGLYIGGTSAATLVARTRNSSNTDNTVNSMNWYLDANSRITYNGTANQMVTGRYPNNFTTTTNSDITLATNAGYHYGYLEIDHQGTIGTNYVYPNASNVFVRTQLDMDRGEFRLDGSGTGYMLNIENPATTGIIVTGAAGDAYIRSETNLGTNPSIVRWYMETTTGSHVIPFGHSAGAANYVPFTFDVNSGGGAGSYVDVSTRATDDGTLANNKDNLPWAAGVTNMWAAAYSQDGATESVIDRWWQIDVSTAYNADLTFSYRGAENTLDAPNNTGNVGAQRWDGTEWLPDNSNFGSAPAVTAGVGTCTVTGITAFSPWVLSSLNAPLPVELLYIDAEKREETNLVKWETGSEINLSYFRVESSLDGKDFKQVGVLPAQGNSTTKVEYELEDFDVFHDILYYRIVSVDYDGTEEKSEVLTVQRDFFNDVIFVPSIYPNPTDGDISIELNTSIRQDVKLSLYDAVGQLVFSETESCEEGSNEFGYSLSDLPPGVYHVFVEGEYGTEIVKLMLK